MPSKSSSPESVAAAFDAVPLEELVRRRVEAILTGVPGHKVEGIYPVVMREVERALVSAVLSHTGGRREEAARLLGLHRNTLRLRIAALGLEEAPKARRS